MELKKLVSLCLTSVIIISHSLPNAGAFTLDPNSIGHIISDSVLNDSDFAQNTDNSGKEIPTLSNFKNDHPQPHKNILPTIYSQPLIPPVHFVLTRNADNDSAIQSPQLKLYPGFGKQLVNRRSSGGGWSAWGINLMNQYFGSGNGLGRRPTHPHQGNYDWPHKPTHNKASQAAALSKVIVTKAKLFTQMLELKRVSTNKFVDMILFLNKLKTVPVFGNLNNPHHYLYNGMPTVTPNIVGSGWQSTTTDLGSTGKDIGHGQGWGQDSKTTAFANLGYSLGSSLAGVSKFAKLLGDGYQYGTEGQRWLTHGFGQGDLHDYYPTHKSPTPNKGQFNSDQNEGAERLKAYQYHQNGPRPGTGSGGTGFGYNYGDGNEYSGVKEGGWSDSPSSTNNFGGGTTGGSGSGNNFVYEEGGNEVTSGLRVPNFKRITTK